MPSPRTENVSKPSASGTESFTETWPSKVLKLPPILKAMKPRRPSGGCKNIPCGDGTPPLPTFGFSLGYVAESNRLSSDKKTTLPGVSGAAGGLMTMAGSLLASAGGAGATFAGTVDGDEYGTSVIAEI
jgi:hypothetical protein